VKVHHGPKWGRAVNEAKIAALEAEMEEIQAADVLYWRQDPNQTREARMEYKRRQDRLKEIIRELADLRFDS
jgi:hypothetical protein